MILLSNVKRPKRNPVLSPGCSNPGDFSSGESAYFSNRAAEAMELELATSPKPGLVSPQDSGAHEDMDYATFITSIQAVRSYFPPLLRISYGREPGPELFREIRGLGLQAEQSMFAATEGINTHKGQIFVLFLLVSSAVAGDGRFCVEKIRRSVRRMTSRIVENELAGLSEQSARTHGEKLYVRYGSTGVRGEAEKGFPSIFETALPAYLEAIGSGSGWNDAAVTALLHLMATADDTTVLHRGGPDAVALMRRMSRKAIELGAARTRPGLEYLHNMAERFRMLGISPGGCADLLAGTLFVSSILNCRGTYGRNQP